MWGNTTSKNRARPSSVTSTWLSYYARINQAWTLTVELPLPSAVLRRRETNSAAPQRLDQDF
jgi:hypothetical protein